MQRRWTKNIDGMQGLSNGERLKSLNGFSIKGRLLRSDLIKYWKILSSDSEEYDLAGFFQKSLEERARGHIFKLVMPQCNTDIKKRSFNVRCVGVWNRLPANVVESQSLTAFKSSLAEFLGEVLFKY